MFFILLLFFIPIIYTATPLSCLDCNKGSEITANFLKYLKTNYWYNKREYKTLKGIFFDGYNDVMSKYETSRLDRAGMSDLVETYRNTMKSIEDSGFKAENLYSLMEIKLKELKVKVDDIFNSFENERLCPNLKNDTNCGVMEQDVIECNTCQRQSLLCVGGTNTNKCDEMVAKCPMCVCYEGSCYHKDTKEPCHACPGYYKCLNEVLLCKTEHIEIHEGEDLAFNCNIQFLASIEEEIEYVFDKRFEFQIHLLQTGSEPNFSKPHAARQDLGHYTCTVRSKESKFPFAKKDFIVKGRYISFIYLENYVALRLIFVSIF
ncbi:hypothetical protein XENTR_v10019102 [Xenopus tropicalis]|nr:hypothetical protein XENTR_v10019102 [Xenopus tropicalis]